MPKIVVQFPKFLVIEDIGHGEFEYGVKFYTGSSLMAVSAYAHLKWPKWSKTLPNWQKFRFGTILSTIVEFDCMIVLLY